MSLTPKQIITNTQIKKRNFATLLANGLRNTGFSQSGQLVLIQRIVEKMLRLAKDASPLRSLF